VVGADLGRVLLSDHRHADCEKLLRGKSPNATRRGTLLRFTRRADLCDIVRPSGTKVTSSTDSRMASRLPL
jgi:hypothetical protein